MNGVHYDLLHDVACAAGLIEEDNTLNECLTENSMFQMSFSLRRLFATILVFCESKDVASLWTKHFDAMVEEFKHNNPNPSRME
jgi:hypothetical protein